MRFERVALSGLESGVGGERGKGHGRRSPTREVRTLLEDIDDPPQRLTLDAKVDVQAPTEHHFVVVEAKLHALVG